MEHNTFKQIAIKSLDRKNLNQLYNILTVVSY